MSETGASGAGGAAGDSQLVASSPQPDGSPASQQFYTKTWTVDAPGPLLHGDGGDVQNLRPLTTGSTDEIEQRHSQLDHILVGLLNEATANKGQAPASGSVTLTSQRVTKSSAGQQQVKQYTETSTLLKTAQREIHSEPSRDQRPEPISDEVDRPSRAPVSESPVTNGPVKPAAAQRPSYVSDSEDPAWLDEQRHKLRAGRRPGWRERVARDRQLVSELRSAQQAWRTHQRTQSESEMTSPAAPYQSDRCVLALGHSFTGVYWRRGTVPAAQFAIYLTTYHKIIMPSVL